MSWGLRTCLSHSQGHGQFVPHGARVPPCRGARFTPRLSHVQSEGSRQLPPAVPTGQLSFVTTAAPQGLSPAPSGAPLLQAPWAPRGQRKGLEPVHRSGVTLSYEVRLAAPGWRFGR